MNDKKQADDSMNYQCLGCGRYYNIPPKVMYEDGHKGRMIEMCQCGSDLFSNLIRHRKGEA